MRPGFNRDSGRPPTNRARRASLPPNVTRCSPSNSSLAKKCATALAGAAGAPYSQHLIYPPIFPVENAADSVENVADSVENVADSVENATDSVENATDSVGNATDSVENVADSVGNVAFPAGFTRLFPAERRRLVQSPFNFMRCVPPGTRRLPLFYGPPART
jgi:hypothetical protein